MKNRKVRNFAEFALWTKTRMLERGISQRELAAGMGTHQARISEAIRKCACQRITMQEADILAETYWDTVTVYRPFKDTLPSGESVFKSGTEGKMMYQDVPCALSSHSGGALAQSSSTASVDTSYSLFVRPEIDILENDFLVISRLGKVIEALAGAAERQPSHNNVPVRLDDPVV